jgi:hypothetical protein
MDDIDTTTTTTQPTDPPMALADLLAHIERVYLPGSPTRQLLTLYRQLEHRKEGPSVPRFEPDDKPAIARLSE